MAHRSPYTHRSCVTSVCQTCDGAGRVDHPHTIAADALRAATGTPWQTVEYRELERAAAGTIWAVEGHNASERSGPYRLTLTLGPAPGTLSEQQRA